MTDWIKWGDLLVSKEDHDELEKDLAVFGNALVESIDGERGRRIPLGKFFVRIDPAKGSDGEQAREEK